jgi:hypothetical protein
MAFVSTVTERFFGCQFFDVVLPLVYLDKQIDKRFKPLRG